MEKGSIRRRIPKTRSSPVVFPKTFRYTLRVSQVLGTFDTGWVVQLFGRMQLCRNRLSSMWAMPYYEKSCVMVGFMTDDWRKKPSKSRTQPQKMHLINQILDHMANLNVYKLELEVENTLLRIRKSVSKHWQKTYRSQNLMYGRLVLLCLL